jgi:uncharacterized membrane protein (DUF373 family)
MTEGQERSEQPADGTAAPTPQQELVEARSGGEEDSGWVRMLERLDGFVYGVVGIAFLAAALFSLAIGLYAAGDQVLTQMFAPTGFSLNVLAAKGMGAQDVIALVSDLLLTLIIMEVLGTVIHHLRERETTLRPFLFIGIISATRGILAVGARLSVSSNQTLTQEEFIRDMVELGVNAVVIIALGVAMKLIGSFLDEGATSRRRRRAASATETAVAAGVQSGSRSSQTFTPQAILATMVLIVLVALTLIAVLITTGRF